ncbi:MAG: formimidoylglutamate deiminase [Actinomycetota bacterium]
MKSRTFHAELAWMGGTSVFSDVLIETGGGEFARVTPGAPAPTDAVRLPGLTLPGLANTHSHVFHRAIRGQAQSGVADFWAWRDTMFRVAAQLDPDSLYRLARATYAEMALAGITSVGEFHYLHHDRGGKPYRDANAMGEAVVRAANDAGIRITLLDACYLQADIVGAPLQGVRQRFDDGSFEGWAQRVQALAPGPLTKIGAAIHSVRAVPRHALRPIYEFADDRGLPLHLHLSEQTAENEECLAAHGLTPTQVMDAEGVWSEQTTAVHATHLTDIDIEILGSTGTTISMCCTTERDLADGIGPAVRLARAGSPLCVGSDAHVVIDLFEEARAIELDERLISGRRGHFRVEELLDALTSAGSASIGWQGGRIAPGGPADLVTIALDTPRTAGARVGDVLSHVVFAATDADVTTVVVAGEPIVEEGRHRLIENVGGELEAAIAAVLSGS